MHRTRHIVTIAAPENQDGGSTEEISTQYRIDQRLRADVTDGKNVIDFELTSD
ncbi:MAG: hypothetical protein KF861_02990 [Planctomycetaceae bacterium]|nr:hypothetical protein [Planctomycetaceae bacterium]